LAEPARVAQEAFDVDMLADAIRGADDMPGRAGARDAAGDHGAARAQRRSRL